MLLIALGGAGFVGVRRAQAGHDWRQAQRLTLRRDFAEAQVRIDACLDFWPSHPNVQFLAARIARLRKQPDDAFRRLDHAKKLGGDAERIVLERYLLRAERGELEQVEKKLLAFLHKDDPDAIFIHDVLTHQWMKVHRLSDALPSLNAWHALQPDQPEPLFRRAWVHERLRDYPAALADYQAALDLDPDADGQNDDRIRMLLAELLLTRLRLQDALVHFEVLAQRRPKNAGVVIGLARCRLLQGQTEAGLKLLDDLLTDQPDHGKALSEAGRALLELQQTGAAETRLRRAFELQPFDKQTVATLHQCLQQLGKADEAKKLESRLELIRADERLMAELMTDVQRAPGDPVLRQRIGELFLRNGLADDGLLWLNSALVYDEHLIPAHEALAEWWESRGEPIKAAPHRDILTRLGAPASQSNRFLQK